MLGQKSVISEEQERLGIRNYHVPRVDFVFFWVSKIPFWGTWQKIRRNGPPQWNRGRRTKEQFEKGFTNETAHIMTPKWKSRWQGKEGGEREKERKCTIVKRTKEKGSVVTVVDVSFAIGCVQILSPKVRPPQPLCCCCYHTTFSVETQRTKHWCWDWCLTFFVTDASHSASCCCVVLTGLLLLWLWLWCVFCWWRLCGELGTCSCTYLEIVYVVSRS